MKHTGNVWVSSAYVYVWPCLRVCVCVSVRKCLRKVPPEVPWPFSRDDWCLMRLSQPAGAAARWRSPEHQQPDGLRGNRSKAWRRKYNVSLVSSVFLSFTSPSETIETYGPTCAISHLKTCMCMHACESCLFIKDTHTGRGGVVWFCKTTMSPLPRVTMCARELTRLHPDNRTCLWWSARGYVRTPGSWGVDTCWSLKELNHSVTGGGSLEPFVVNRISIS